MPHAEARRGDIQRAMVWMLLTKVQDVAIYGYEEIREYPKINDVQNPFEKVSFQLGLVVKNIDLARRLTVDRAYF